ncbi:MULTISPECIES: hypothetical protein [unclassified Streptomyces]|uniref:hypothetical protein n=1 Tax=unclassified Streptomyces TaxID=2593676 RepID=UPI003827AA35
MRQQLIGTLETLADAHGHPYGQLAHTGSTAERLWLLGGVALALTGAGAVALAATRGRRD